METSPSTCSSLPTAALTGLATPVLPPSPPPSRPSRRCGSFFSGKQLREAPRTRPKETRRSCETAPFRRGWQRADGSSGSCVWGACVCVCVCVCVCGASSKRARRQSLRSRRCRRAAPRAARCVCVRACARVRACVRVCDRARAARLWGASVCVFMRACVCWGRREPWRRRKTRARPRARAVVFFAVLGDWGAQSRFLGMCGLGTVPARMSGDRTAELLLLVFAAAQGTLFRYDLACSGPEALEPSLMACNEVELWAGCGPWCRIATKMEAARRARRRGWGRFSTAAGRKDIFRSVGRQGDEIFPALSLFARLLVPAARLCVYIV